MSKKVKYSKRVGFGIINQSMNKTIFNKSSLNDGEMVCITNGLEVLRITKKEAKEFFFNRINIKDLSKEELALPKYKDAIHKEAGEKYYYEPTHKWAYTDKRTYKQYIESMKEGSNIPAPIFSQTFSKIVENKDTGIDEITPVTITKNIYQ